jgi:NAD-dependent dihydropyrimidine dehydrogenase PreA subunit
MIIINQEKCDGCGNCIEVCPFNVLEIKNGKVKVKSSKKCKGCEACACACPNNAIKIKKGGIKNALGR